MRRLKRDSLIYSVQSEAQLSFVDIQAAAQNALFFKPLPVLAPGGIAIVSELPDTVECVTELMVAKCWVVVEI